MLTGESLPVEKAAGTPWSGGTVNRTGSFSFRATRVGADTALARIIRLVEEAQGSRRRSSASPTASPRYFVPACSASPALTFVGWLAVRARAAGCHRARRRGRRARSSPAPARWAWPRRPRSWSAPARAPSTACSIRGGEALERPASSTPVVLDKTGTITRGKPGRHRHRARERPAPTTSCCAWPPPPSAAPSIRWARRSSPRAQGARLALPPSSRLRGHRRPRRRARRSRAARPARERAAAWRSAGIDARRPAPERAAALAAAARPACSWRSTARRPA